MARPRSCGICQHPDCDRINELGSQDLPHEEIRALVGSQFSLRTLRNHYDHVEVDSSSYASEPVADLDTMDTQADMVKFGVSELQKIIVKLGTIVDQTGSLRATDHLVRALDSWARYSDRLAALAPEDSREKTITWTIKRLDASPALNSSEDALQDPSEDEDAQ